MHKPYLIVITGRPGAGKTTLSEEISRSWYMPLLSRDRLKEGYVHTMGKGHNALPEDANLTVTTAFFDMLEFMLDRGISVIAEAAFQHAVWEKFLTSLADKAQIVVIICRVDGETALKRFLARGLSDEKREHFHGDKGVQTLKAGERTVVGSYNEPQLPYRTFYVDTTDGYKPTTEELYQAVFEQSEFSHTQKDSTVPKFALRPDGTLYYIGRKPKEDQNGNSQIC